MSTAASDASRWIALLAASASILAPHPPDHTFSEQDTADKYRGREPDGVHQLLRQSADDGIEHHDQLRNDRHPQGVAVKVLHGLVELAVFHGARPL